MADGRLRRRIFRPLFITGSPFARNLWSESLLHASLATRKPVLSERGPWLCARQNSKVGVGHGLRRSLSTTESAGQRAAGSLKLAVSSKDTVVCLSSTKLVPARRTFVSLTLGQKEIHLQGSIPLCNSTCEAGQ